MKQLLLSLLILAATATYGQYFEGEVVYNNTYKSKIQGLSDTRLQVMMGDAQQYFIKGGKYKSVINGQIVTLQLYNDNENRIYSKTAKSDTLYWFDASGNTDELTSYEITKNATVILGYPCDMIKMQTKNGATTVYYSAAYKLDSTKFAKHQYANWAFFTAKAGTIPLKTILETPQFTMESTATEVNPMKLEDSFFAIDKKTPTKHTDY